MNRGLMKAVLGLVFVVALFSGLGALAMPEHQNFWWKWIIFIIAGLTALGTFAILFKLERQHDLAPDFLFQQTGKYFDRDGFCFSFVPKKEDGVCVLHILFQNRYDQPAEGRVALRPARELFMRADIPIIGIDIVCEPGAFGVARLPFPVPAKYQGSKQKFEVGADVRYPQGKGRMLRFRSAMLLRAGTNFTNSFGTALTVAGAAAGAIVISSPASLTFRMPTDVAETASCSSVAVATIWKLGDPVPPEANPKQRSLPPRVAP